MPALYLGKNCGLATMKWASADRPRNIATVNPIGVSKSVTGSAKVVPGGPVIYVALIGSEKSLLKARTATICARCRMPAKIFTLRRLWDVISLLIGKRVAVIVRNSGDYCHVRAWV
jgi:hypothetical protein